MHAAQTLAPFDLSRALAGAKIVTRDGKPVTGFHCARPNGSSYPFDAKVDGKLYCFTENGTFWIGKPDSMDLFMEGQ